jgi:hypothetical protein
VKYRVYWFDGKNDARYSDFDDANKAISFAVKVNGRFTRNE